MKKTIPFLILALVTLTSANVSPVEKSVTQKTTEVESSLEKALLDGKINQSELKTIAETAKGKKLTFKEKISLKLFGKKISSKIEESQAAMEGGGKSQIVALILVALVGGLGIHRFYLGYTWQGIVQLLTLGGCGIWALIDLVRIITGDLKPKDGEYEKTL